MMKHNDIDPRLIHLLDELRPVPARDPRAATRGRARFLAEAVSASENRRHSLWTLFPHKEQYAMNIIVSTIVIVGLLFGGGATVAAAQNDLPNESLYPLKLMSEDASLWFVSDPLQEIDRLMQQAQNRVQEMQALASQGVTPPAGLTTHAQERIQRALQIAAQLNQTEQTAALQQIQMQLQTQLQQMEQSQSGDCSECDAALLQTREMLRLQLREAEDGLADPQQQNQNQQQNQYQNQIRITQTPQPSDSTVPSYGTCTPALDGTGQQNGGNQSAATPVQQNNQNQQSGGGNQNGTGSGGGSNPSPGSGGQGGKP